MARLRPGQTAAEAAAQLEAVRPQIRAATLPQDWPAAMQARYLSAPLALVPASTGESDLRREYLTPLEIVLGVVGAVLLIACANLASLLLARAASRRHELSVRLALGASRFRLTKLLLLESGLLAAGGAGLGLVVAKWGSALLVRQLATDPTGVTLDLSFDWRVLAFTTAIAAATALLFGLAPALGVGRVAPNEVMKEHSHNVIGDRRFGVRNALVVGQVALSLALVVAAALFVRTLVALTGAPLGFTPDRLLSARLDARAGDPGREELLSLYGRVTASAQTVPGVANAAISVVTPVSHRGWNTVIDAEPDAPPSTARERMAWVNVVSPGWFSTFGMHVLDGRDFDSHDANGAERVAVSNESFARRFLAGRAPVGMQVRTDLEGSDTTAFRIVGVVNDSVYQSARAGFAPTLYVPLAQINRVMSSAVLTVRAERGEPGALAHDLADAIARADRTVAFTIDPVSQQVSASIRQERLVAMLAGFFGALALLLAAIGLYGVASHSVNQRRAEIGIRMALGADASGVIRLVLARLTVLLAAGVAGGIALSWWTSRYVATLLFGLGPRDPATFAAAAALLVGIGLLAGWMPRAARRASTPSACCAKDRAARARRGAPCSVLGAPCRCAVLGAGARCRCSVPVAVLGGGARCECAVRVRGASARCECAVPVLGAGASCGCAVPGAGASCGVPRCALLGDLRSQRAPSTQHPARSTQHGAPSTEHPARSTRTEHPHGAPAPEHRAPAPSTAHQAPSTSSCYATDAMAGAIASAILR